VRVALYDEPLFREHDSGRGHPERPERVEAIRRGLRDAGLEPRLLERQARPATREELRRVHTEELVRAVAATQGRTVRFDPDTQAGPRSYQAALHAAGAAVDAVQRVLDGGIDRAFCLCRPPGHHAERDRAMGFCLFNNAAVAAAHALAAGLHRVLIVDFDVHHGNGTQHIFEDDPRVLYVSSHEYPFYPGTGAIDEVGEGEGRGFTVNLPMPAGLGDGDYAAVFREVVEPIGRAFAPELVLVSAGFDAYVDDPLAGMRLTARGYRELMQVCLDCAAGARGVVVLLEGGYDLDGLADCGAEVARGLLGERAEPVAPAARVAPLLEAYRRTLRPYWPMLEGP
jgi:acetoin utilization deacetylase AcuC-like enzyme